MVTRNQLIALGVFVVLGAGVLWFGREDTSRTDNPELKRRQFMQGQAPDAPDASLAPPVGSVSSTATGTSTATGASTATGSSTTTGSSTAKGTSTATSTSTAHDAPGSVSTSANSAATTTAQPDFEFPASPTKELFLSKCTVCHSLKYITMQNDFSKEFWQEEMDKMINEYHAQITPPEANAIVLYLSTIKR
ncbi:MAG TPA: hypothetical protein V6C76_12255 [Drouetiella sp.]